MISATMGTPYEIDAKGKILFLEDVGEEPYRIDRMLTQLRLSGKLNEASGIVIGECSGCDFDKLKSSRDWDYSFGEVIDSILGDLKIPVFTGLTAGHTGDQLTLPLGIKVELDADQYQLNFTESALS
jgi:muramoyltetrapeptide carboxypeptidase